MVLDTWYRTSDIMIEIGLKESRTRELLKNLVDSGQLEDDGATRGKRYKRI